MLLQPYNYNILRTVISAYEVLSDPDKRKKYDQFGEAAFSQNGGGGDGFQDFNMNDFFKGFDNAFHNQGGHDNSFHFSFGDGNSAFDFDNMFSDDEGDDFYGGNSFTNMGFGDDPWDFGNQFDDGFGFNSVHDAHHMHSHQHSHHQAHKQASHMNAGGGEYSLSF